MAPTGNGKTILLAEDEQHVRRAQTVKRVRRRYSLLLSDVEMPNMTGIELATQLQIDKAVDSGSVDVRDGGGNAATE